VRDGEIRLDGDVAVDAELVLRCAAAAAYEGLPIAKATLRLCRDGLAPPPSASAAACRYLTRAGAAGAAQQTPPTPRRGLSVR
jgi:hypothetical protein